MDAETASENEVKIEMANRLVFMNSWDDWKSETGEQKSLTVNAWILSGTKSTVVDGCHEFHELFSSTELRTLVTGLVTRVHHICTDESSLRWSGIGVALGHYGVAIKTVFSMDNIAFSPGLELHMILGEQMKDCSSDVESQSSGDLDSMASSRFYIESLRDYFYD